MSLLAFDVSKYILRICVCMCKFQVISEWNVINHLSVVQPEPSFVMSFVSVCFHASEHIIVIWTSYLALVHTYN
jgi:hypothetical protein